MARLEDAKETLEQERRALGDERARIAEKGAEARSMAKSMDKTRRCDWLVYCVWLVSVPCVLFFLLLQFVFCLLLVLSLTGLVNGNSGDCSNAININTNVLKTATPVAWLPGKYAVHCMTC